MWLLHSRRAQRLLTKTHPLDLERQPSVLFTIFVVNPVNNLVHSFPLPAQPHPLPLLNFVSDFVPPNERTFNFQQKAETKRRASEVKV